MTAHRTVPAWNDGRGYVEGPAPTPVRDAALPRHYIDPFDAASASLPDGGCGDGRRLVEYAAKLPALDDDWQVVTLATGQRAWVRRAACGLGCRCGGEIALTDPTPPAPVEIPRPPFLMASDPGHGEYFIDADGRAYNAVRERVPDLDGPPAKRKPFLPLRDSRGRIMDEDHADEDDGPALAPERDRAGDAAKLYKLWAEARRARSLFARMGAPVSMADCDGQISGIINSAAALGLGDELRGLIDGGPQG